jgi:S1-C subfamily serine protease
MIKKRKKQIHLGLILILFVFACCNCSTTNNIQNKFLGSKPLIPNVSARNSFVKVNRIMNVQLCIDTLCVKGSYVGSGSGTIVAKENKDGYILTANHVCVEQDTIPPEIKVLSIDMVAIDIENKIHKARIVSLDPINDLCILKVEDIKYNAIKVSPTPPEIGERIINIAAPGGIFSDRMVPIFDAIYVGDIQLKERKISTYTGYAYGGSSGSMFLNYNGELVGLLHSGFSKIPTIVLSPTWEILKDFIFNSLINNCSKCEL